MKISFLKSSNVKVLGKQEQLNVLGGGDLYTGVCSNPHTNDDDCYKFSGS